MTPPLTTSERRVTFVDQPESSRQDSSGTHQVRTMSSNENIRLISLLQIEYAGFALLVNSNDLPVKHFTG